MSYTQPLAGNLAFLAQLAAVSPVAQQMTSPTQTPPPSTTTAVDPTPHLL